MTKSKADDLMAMFEEHNKSIEGSNSKKFALALVKDGDGDYAIVEVEEGSPCKVLGFILDDEAAMEFTRVINLIGSDDCKTAFESSEEVEDALLNGIIGLFD